MYKRKKARREEEETVWITESHKYTIDLNGKVLLCAEHGDEEVEITVTGDPLVAIRIPLAHVYAWLTLLKVMDYTVNGRIEDEAN
jgi:hypothetical protein